MTTIIQDLAGNLLQTQTSPMLGWIEPAEAAEALNLDMYRFLIEIIRQEDAQRGNDFVKRFLQGPQEVWRTNTDKILSLKSLWDISTVDAKYLPYIKRIVGWTPDLDDITDSLSELTLRRLIAASVPFWKKRGPEDAILDVLRLATTARVRIWNWFDLRVVLDETSLGEDWNGYDSWMVSVDDDNEYEVRIVDDGTLDRALVRNLVRLTRPVGETCTVYYIGFLDQFRVNNDTSQWASEAEPRGFATPSSLAVGSYVATLDAASQWEEAYVDVTGADDWQGYVATFRIRGNNARVLFYRTTQEDYYELTLGDDSVITLYKLVGGTATALATFDLSSISASISSDVFHAIRVHATQEGAYTRIAAYFESVEVFNLLDDAHTQGTIGFGHAAGAADFAVLDEVELFFDPLESDIISINS